MKELPTLSKSSGLSLEYMISLGGVKQYLERAEEFFKDKDLPPRWLNLAERTLLHRKVNTYFEAFDPQHYADVLTDYNKKNIESLDTIVAEINIIREKPEAARTLRNIESDDFKRLSTLYTQAKEIVIYGLK